MKRGRGKGVVFSLSQRMKKKKKKKKNLKISILNNPIPPSGEGVCNKTFKDPLKEK